MGVITPFQSVELDAALFDMRCKDFIPDTLCVYSRDRLTASVGRSGSVEDIRTDGERDICIVRRISGGSTIITDRDQITISFVTK